MRSIWIFLGLLVMGMGGAQANPPWQVPGRPGVTEKTIHFVNGAIGLTGTLYMPATGNHLPAIVALHGADTPTRDYALYRHLTEGLPAMGMAVLIFDRRGSGQSSGSLAGAGYDVLADDAIAGARVLAREPRIDPTHIGYWGLSQGGWLSVVAAGRDPKAAFAVSVSAPLVTASQQMHFATADQLYVHGASQADIQAVGKARDAWEGYLRGTRTREQALAALGGIEHKSWFDLTFMPHPAEMTPREKSGYRLQMDEDPVRAVARVKAPILFIFGGADPWIPVALSVTRLEKIAKTKRDIETHVIAGASHEMVLNAHETMAFDKKTMLATAPDAPAYFAALASWLGRRAK
jgi:uncharacterized protein